MSELLEALRKRGWVVEERSDATELLPPEVSTRYPSVPAAITDFLGRLDECHNTAEDVWMLTPEEFRKSDPDGFRWNEYELMALESSKDNPAAQGQIRAFWNEHVPIMLAVHSDYDYLAVRVAEPERGSIVHGFAPDWESPSRVSRSFEEFLAAFTKEANSAEPEYPFSVFL
jgi:hypothetical protein